MLTWCIPVAETVTVARCTVLAGRTRPIRVAVRRLVPALILLLGLPAAAQLPACGSSARHDCSATPEAALLPLWKELPNQREWQMLVSPAFPRTWPPSPNSPGSVVRYAFATRLKPGMADGAEMAAPWARVTLEATGAQRVEQLSRRLQPLGIQEVRPLGLAEITLTDRETEAAERLLAGGTQARSSLVRDVTCGWISRQGVVAATIIPLHPGFVRWLVCSGTGR